MMRRTARSARLPRRAFQALALCAVVLLPTACSNGSASDAAGESGSVPTVPVDAAAAKLLPNDIRSAKVLRVAIPTNEPPTQFYKTGTREMTGINPDIARLIGATLGLKVEIDVANFDGIIPGIAAGRYDMTVSSMTPTTARMKVLDFVDYMQVGDAIAVPKGNPLDLDEKSLCGHRVALLTGSYQLTVEIPEYDKACADAGKPKIDTSEYQDTRQAISALISGRQDAVLADSPILNFAAAHNPSISIAAAYEFAPVSVGVPKDTGLVKALAPAVASMIKGEAYKAVLAKYGVANGAITDARVNVAQ